MSEVQSEAADSVFVELADPHDQLCFALYSAKRLMIKRQRRALDALGLTHPQYLVLLVLWEWDRDHMHRPTMVALGERLELDSGTLTPLLKRLERRQLITRMTWYQSRRERHIHLTAAGRALRERAEGIAISMRRSNPLPTEEIVTLQAQINRLRASLDASSAQEPGVLDESNARPSNAPESDQDSRCLKNALAPCG